MLMSIKEAIKIIRTTAVTYPDPDSQDVWDEAIRMAISALEEQEAKNVTLEVM